MIIIDYIVYFSMMITTGFISYKTIQAEQLELSLISLGICSIFFVGFKLHYAIDEQKDEMINDKSHDWIKKQ